MDDKIKHLMGIEFFEVTSLCRDDFHSVGYEGAFLSEADMKRAAEWIEESLLDNLYWQVLREFAQHYQLPKFVGEEVKSNGTEENISAGDCREGKEGC